MIASRPRHGRSVFRAHIAALAGAGMALGAAWVAERWGGLVPCALCLVERWPYRAVIALALLGLILPRYWSRIAATLAVVTLLAGAAVAATHVGVEQGWWASPLPECEAPRIDPSLPIAEQLARMPARPSKACEDPTYVLPGVPVSMAEANFGFTLALAALLAILIGRSRR